MKKVKLLAIILLSVSSAFSQVKPQQEIAQSNFETFSKATGTFSKTEIFTIGQIGDIKVQALKLVDLSTGKLFAAIRLSAKYTSNNTTREKIGFLDLDEIEGLLKSLDYIQTSVITSEAPGYDVEYNYYSRGGISAGALSRELNWWIYVKLVKDDKDSFFNLSKSELPQLIRLIKAATTRL